MKSSCGTWPQADMRVLVSYLRLKHPGGTEVYALTVAEHLERLGHDAALVTWLEGAMSERARARGLRVITPDAVKPGTAEVIVASDAATMLTLAKCVPTAVRIMVMHSVEYTVQTPPQLPDACQAVVVLSERVRRRAEALAITPRVVRLRHPIDLDRYRLLPWPQRPPRRVAIFGHIAGGARPDSFSAACRSAGLEPSVVGRPGGTATTEPERVIGEVDIVVGIGRCALEGVSARRPVYVAGPAGVDGWLRPELYTTLERDGFSGQALSRTAGVLPEELANPPSPDEVQTLYEQVTREHDVRVHAEELVALARELGAPPGPVRGPVDEISRLVRLEFSARERADAAERRGRGRVAYMVMRRPLARYIAAGVRSRLARLRKRRRSS
jgi:hypothetical protein